MFFPVSEQPVSIIIFRISYVQDVLRNIKIFYLVFFDLLFFSR